MNIIKKIKQLRHKILIKLFRLIPINKKKILFWTNSFKGYGCNTKYICEYIIKHFPGEFELVWVFDKDISIPKEISDEIKIVRYFSINYLFEIHTAKFIIGNTRTNSSFCWQKRKEQIYIQTWHSSLRLKVIGEDSQKNMSALTIQEAINDSAKIDYIISGCKFSSNIFKNAFWYNGPVIECGTPRIDYLLNFNNREEVLNKMGLSCEYKYILYAPTFRNDSEFEYSLDFKKLTEICKEKFGGEWRVLYRLHPNLIHKITQYNLSDVCINMCRYPDMQELIVVSDIMVTDYSSCMFDMMYIKKPCILYVPDLNNYLEKERDLYFKIEELPWFNALTEDELYDYINNFSKHEYIEKVNCFLSNIDSFENGTACKIISDLLIEKRN